MTKCPHCQSDVMVVLPDGRTEFMCGSIRALDGSVDCSALCYKAQLESIASVLGEHPDTSTDYMVQKISDIRSEARRSANADLKYCELKAAADALARAVGSCLRGHRSRKCGHTIAMEETLEAYRTATTPHPRLTGGSDGSDQ